MSTHDASDLKRIYEARFSASLAYRKKVWEILVADFFQRYVARGDTVLDLGCGYGEFINVLRCGKNLPWTLIRMRQNTLIRQYSF